MYITGADIITRFGRDELAQILAVPIDDLRPDHERLLAACRDADAIIDSYLSRALDLPLKTPPAVLIAYAADIARYRLHDDQVEDGTSVQRKRYQDAILWLERVARGEVSLIAHNEQQQKNIKPSPMAVSSVSGLAVVSSPPVFTDDLLAKGLVKS